MWSDPEIAEFGDLVSALKNYRRVCHRKITALEGMGGRSPDAIAQLRNAVNSNADLLEYVAHKSPSAFNEKHRVELPVTRTEDEFDSTDLRQVSAALRTACRDWTSLGDVERQQTHTPILEALDEYLPKGAVVCVPGAGLCRLAVEIASNGFTAVANEHALVMIAFSRIAMKMKRTFHVYPFCHQLSGLDGFDGSMVHAAFPEVRVRGNDEESGIVDPVKLLQNENLILMAGDFHGLRTTAKRSFDAVVTSYFIDVVTDISDTVAAIHEILKPGGYWINIGPMMLHHGDDDFFPLSTLDDVTAIARKSMFQILKEDSVETTYIQNPKAHIRTQYRCRFFVARK